MYDLNQLQVCIYTEQVGILMKTSEKIRSLRKKQEWSQKEMAEKLNMSVNGYSKIERGESVPSIARLQQIADTFGVALTDLLPSNDGNIVFMINEGDNYHGSFYNNAQDLNIELEKLRHIIEQKDLLLKHKDELLAQQARELSNMQKLIDLLK